MYTDGACAVRKKNVNHVRSPPINIKHAPSAKFELGVLTPAAASVNLVLIPIQQMYIINISTFNCMTYIGPRYHLHVWLHI